MDLNVPFIIKHENTVANEVVLVNVKCCTYFDDMSSLLCRRYPPDDGGGEMFADFTGRQDTSAGTFPVFFLVFERSLTVECLADVILTCPSYSEYELRLLLDVDGDTTQGGLRK